jgi:hypothetical protein
MRFHLGELDVEVRAMGDSVRALIRREGQGGLALRAAYPAGKFHCAKATPEAREAARLTVKSAIGEHLIVFRSGGCPTLSSSSATRRGRTSANPRASRYGFSVMTWMASEP